MSPVAQVFSAPSHAKKFITGAQTVSMAVADSGSTTGPRVSVPDLEESVVGSSAVVASVRGEVC